MSVIVGALRGWLSGGLVVMTSCAGLGCSADEDRPAAIGDCTGEGCAPNGGMTGQVREAGAADAADAADAALVDAAGEVDLSGSIVTWVDATFENGVPYPGFGTLRFPTLAGDDVVPFGGDAGVGFAATGVRAGPGWFTVVPGQDAVSLDTIPTWAFVDVPAVGSEAFELPVLTRTQLASIYLTLSSNPMLRTDAAQVVVVFEREGVREPGAYFTNVPTSEAIAFDTGTGYSSEMQVTGDGGVGLLVNVTGAGALSWSTSAGESGSMTLVHVAGQASFVRVDVGR